MGESWRYNGRIKATFRFSDLFRGYRKAIPGCNGLNTKTGANPQLSKYTFKYLDQQKQMPSSSWSCSSCAIYKTISKKSHVVNMITLTFELVY